MAVPYINKVKIKGTVYDIHATEADTAKVAQKTQGTLKIGKVQYNGSEDVSVPIYNGEVSQ